VGRIKESFKINSILTLGMGGGGEETLYTRALDQNAKNLVKKKGYKEKFLVRMEKVLPGKGSKRGGAPDAKKT